ncbi:hypothetical protein MTO96_036523 [Rhipicephalus appendiculatus]
MTPWTALDDPNISAKKPAVRACKKIADLDMLQLTSTERQDLIMGLYPPGMAPKPTELFSFTEEVEQYPSSTRVPVAVAAVQLQPQQQEQTQQQPQPVLQQHVTWGPNVSDSNASTSSPSFSLLSSSEHSAMDDHVKYKTQTVPALGPTPPLWYKSSDEDIIGDVQQTTMHQAPQQQSRCEEFSSCKRTVTLALDNAGRSQPISEQAHCPSLQAVPDMSRLQLTSPKRDELNIGFHVPETPPKPTTIFSSTEEEKQYPSRYADVLPPLQPQQREQAQQQPQPVLQQHVTSGPNVADSRKWTVTLDLDNAGSLQHNSEQARMMHTVPRPGAEPPLSPMDMREGVRTKLEKKRYRNRIAQAKCRKRKIDRITFLQLEVRKLEMEKAMMESMVNFLRYQVSLLRQQVETHVTHCGQT